MRAETLSVYLCPFYVLTPCRQLRRGASPRAGTRGDPLAVIGLPTALEGGGGTGRGGAGHRIGIVLVFPIGVAFW